MPNEVGTCHIIRFATFEFDLQAQELRKAGLRLKLTGQPFQVLAILLEHSGTVVTREELQKRLWPDTFVDVDHNLNTAINKIREALDDSSENPRFVETLPRRGYRFICDVHNENGRTRARNSRRITMGALLVLLLLIGLGAALLPGRWPHENADTATIHSLAVIPLENLSDDSEQEYFVDGLTDELIASIAKISQLRVISRTSVMRYKGARRPIAEIARELKVDGIVEGTVLRSGDRVRITAQLIEARTDKHLWGETYYGDLRDILTLQTQVTKAIASEVRIKVAPQRMEVAHQVNPEAYELYLKGRSYADRLTPASRGAATRYYERSIELDPNFALANAFLAESLVLAQADEASRKDLPRARAAINRALELDPTLSSAHTLLGMIHLSWEWDWAGAERECKRALELNPNDWAAHYGYAYYLHVINRPQEALAESNRALEFDPFSPRTISQKAYMLDYLHRHEEANQLYRRTLELDPGFERARYGLLWNDFRADLQSKNYVEAKHAIEIIIGKRSPLGGTTRNSVQPLRNILESNHDRSGLGILQTASAYSLLGDRDRAMQCLEQAFASRLRALNELVSNPDWEPLHSDPRFRAMANRMNLPLPN